MPASPVKRPTLNMRVVADIRQHLCAGSKGTNRVNTLLREAMEQEEI